MESIPQHREMYTHGYSEERRHIHGQRVAEVEAAFLLPHLQPGMRLLDFGCGPGSITVGLARAVAPARVVGIDIATQQVTVAHALAADMDARNLRFAVSSVYDLPFPDASFDAAFSRSVLEHLADPLAALREVRRVLKPGGVIGVRDGDWGGLVLAPPNTLVEEGLALYARLWALNGGNPKRGHEHRALLRAAGFSRIVASAGADAMGTPEAVRQRAALLAEQLT
ncbi:MAG: methyltransferase domain-containing protein, partial [Thermomicrobiales bacterium]